MANNSIKMHVLLNVEVKSPSAFARLCIHQGRWIRYHFVENGERDALESVWRDLMEELERKLRQRIGKRGFVMG